MPPDASDEVLFSLQDRVVRGEASTGEGSPGDYLILDLDSGRYYGVGEAGGFIWEHLDGASELRRIGEAVAKHFDIETSRAATDLLDFVTRLYELGLVERVDNR